mmetsp:Transcript_18424/g.22125  ORF Transcript_18424/g.22125 Transcript_18424/m.22125 type:complete len:340 (+) Transcript_18424:82-1101(+)
MRLTVAVTSLLVGIATVQQHSICFGFTIAGSAPKPSTRTTPTQRFNSEDPFDRFDFPSDAEVIAEEVDVEPIDIAPEAIRLKEDLLALASVTKRGFASSKEQRQKAKDIVYDLASYNPTKNPASPYYSSKDSGGMVYEGTCTSTDGSDLPTLAGKWTLIYTDAPDITGLDGGPLATAKLGRIGQECTPPLIKNVIEWRRPDWAASLPFSGSDDSRVLQKVCVEASAKPEKPFEVDLKIVGLDVMALNGNSRGGDTNGMDSADNDNDNTALLNNLHKLPETIQQDGIPVGLLKSNPIELRGPLTVPFGQFEILYLDDEMRIIKTGQNYIAVNVRDEEEWF